MNVIANLRIGEEETKRYFSTAFKFVSEYKSDNRDLHNEVEIIKKDYEKKEFDLEWNYKNIIKHLEKEEKQKDFDLDI